MTKGSCGLVICALNIIHCGLGPAQSRFALSSSTARTITRFARREFRHHLTSPFHVRPTTDLLGIAEPRILLARTGNFAILFLSISFAPRPAQNNDL